MLISTATAAGLLGDALGVEGLHPLISGVDMDELTLADLFVNHTPESEEIHLEADEVIAFGTRIRHLSDSSALAPLIFRVNITAPHPDEVRSALDGRILRTHAGVSYTNRLGLSEDDWVGGFTGTWRVSEKKADYLADHHALLVAACQGYVAPECVRTIVGWEPVEGSPRRFFHTEPAPAEVSEMAGDGLWIDVLPVREAAIDVDDIDDVATAT